MLKMVLRFKDVDFTEVTTTEAIEFLGNEGKLLGLTDNEINVSIVNILKL